MVITLAIVFYKLIKRFPIIVLFIYTTECCAAFESVELEKELTEEVDFMNDVNSLIKKRIAISEDAIEHVITTQIKESVLNIIPPYIKSSHNKLYILYCSFLIDRK